MKRIFTLLLCFVMVLSLLAACGGGEKKTTEKKPSKTDGPVTITIGIPKSTLVIDYEDNDYTKWLEEKTGYNLEFQPFASASQDYKTQLSTMVAGNLELPDLLMGFNLGTDLYERYGRDGIFQDLSPYFNDREKSATWWERFEMTDEYSQTNNWRRMQAADGSGSIYAFPELQDSMIDIMDYQVWINQEWLNAVNMPMPTNPDELYEVLKAFKTGDPNGNGQPDEIPMVGTAAGSLSGETLHWLINMFVYEDDTTYFNVDENGKLYSPYTTDAYRDALKYIRKLYKEGLMSPLTLTASGSDLKNMVTPATGDQIAGVVCGHLTLCFVQDDPGILAYEALPMWGNTIFHENAHNFTTFVTKDCENVDAVWDLLMVMSTEESAIIQRYGSERTEENPNGTWNWADEGAQSIMSTEERPHPAQIRLYKDTWSTRGNDNWRNVEATILLNAEGEGNQAVENEDPVRQHKYDLFNKALQNYYYQIENHNPADELICPLLVWPDEYKEELPLAPADCKSYIGKARTDFITGVTDINSDKDWQSYLDTLDSLGFAQWLQYSQWIYEDIVANQ